VDVSRIPPGRKPPEEINVLIEVPLRADPIEYEFDKETGAIFVDRYLYTTMFHPCNYGFVPNTLAEDGDPVDVMVVGRMPPLPGAVLRVRPIGVLGMEDEAGMDEKILGVPIARITPVYSNVRTYRDLPELDLARIAHFFEHSKDLEPDKWVRVIGWEGPERPHELIVAAIARAAAEERGT
jgi:inorganic pyrophosphatase